MIVLLVIIIIVIMIWIPTAITVNHCDLDHCPKLDEGGRRGTIDNGDRKQILLRQVVRLHLFTCTLARLLGRGKYLTY